MKKLILSVCALAMMGAVMLPIGHVVYAEGDVWQQGGLATNQVSEGTAKTQQGISIALASWGLLTNAFTFGIAMTPISFTGKAWSPGGALIDELEPPPNFTIVPTGGTTYGLNTDIPGVALDALLVYDKHRQKSQLSAPIPDLEAAARNIGSAEDLEAECEGLEPGEGPGECNIVSASQDHSKFYIQTLKNVGLEALEDLGGKVWKLPAELIAAAPLIQAGFGTEVGNINVNSAVNTTSNGGVIDPFKCLTDYPNTSIEECGKLLSGTTTQPKRSQEEIDKINLRRLAHLQFTGTAGVARADLGATVARSEAERFKQLHSYVGSGSALIPNIKILTGLDLTLTQRLNLLNMLQGQTIADDAASLLQYVTIDE